MKRTALEGSGILEGGLACFRIWAHQCWKFNLVRKYKVLRVEPCEVPRSQVWGWEVLLHRRIRLRVLEGGKTNEMKQHPGYLMYNYILVMQDKILDASVCVIWRASMDVYCVILVEGFKENMFSDVTLPIGELHHHPHHHHRYHHHRYHNRQRFLLIGGVSHGSHLRAGKVLRQLLNSPSSFQDELGRSVIINKIPSPPSTGHWASPPPPTSRNSPTRCRRGFSRTPRTQ